MENKFGFNNMLRRSSIFINLLVGLVLLFVFCQKANAYLAVTNPDPNSPIKAELYDNNGYAFYFHTYSGTNGDISMPVNSYDILTPIMFEDKSSLVSYWGPEGYNFPCDYCYQKDQDSGQMRILRNPYPGFQTAEGVIGFEFDLQVLGWSAGTTTADIVNQYGTVSADIYFFLTNGDDARTTINFPNIYALQNISAVPLPPALPLFLFGLLGLVGLSKKPS